MNRKENNSGFQSENKETIGLEELEQRGKILQFSYFFSIHQKFWIIS